jgi:hypothetical protein
MLSHFPQDFRSIIPSNYFPISDRVTPDRSDSLSSLFAKTAWSTRREICPIHSTSVSALLTYDVTPIESQSSFCRSKHRSQANHLHSPFPLLRCGRRLHGPSNCRGPKTRVEGLDFVKPKTRFPDRDFDSISKGKLQFSGKMNCPSNMEWTVRAKKILCVERDPTIFTTEAEF